MRFERAAKHFRNQQYIKAWNSWCVPNHSQVLNALFWVAGWLGAMRSFELCRL